MEKPRRSPAAVIQPCRKQIDLLNCVCVITDLNGSSHIYQTIGGEWGSSSDAAANRSSVQQRDDEHDARSATTMESGDRGGNSVYARVSKKMRLTEPPVHTPEPLQIEEEEEEESSPPLPDRTEQMEG